MRFFEKKKCFNKKAHSVPKSILHKYRHYTHLLLRGLSTINTSGWLIIQVSFKDQVIRFLSHSGTPYLSFDDDQRKISATLETRAESLAKEFSSSIHYKCTTIISSIGVIGPPAYRLTYQMDQWANTRDKRPGQGKLSVRSCPAQVGVLSWRFQPTIQVNLAVLRYDISTSTLP
jgi:hypothetical protein